jgi:hypothetical protein
MDWGLVIMLVLGGLVSAGFGWIAMNNLSRGKGTPPDSPIEPGHAPGRE